MAIFRRATAPAPAAPGTAQREPREPSAAVPSTTTTGRRPTHVAEGTRLVGELSGGTEVVIEGEVEGSVQVDNRVTIAGGGRIRGPVTARTVQIGGQVQGNVRAVERVEITASGALEGDVAAPKVVIADGAFFKGKIEMTGEGGAAVTRPAAPKERPQAAGKDVR